MALGRLIDRNGETCDEYQNSLVILPLYQELTIEQTFGKFDLTIHRSIRLCWMQRFKNGSRNQALCSDL